MGATEPAHGRELNPLRPAFPGMADHEWLRRVRRDLHRHPEPAWCEFYTTGYIADELEKLGVDYELGRAFLAADARLGVPDASEIDEWRERAREAGTSDDVLDACDGGFTGLLATVERGEGPTVTLRVDIDGLPRKESTAESHTPVREGFRSETPAMHACGHDAHAAIGLGVLADVLDSDFSGTFRVLFQPAEETAGGAKPVAESGVLDDTDYLFAVHVGLDHPTGEITAGIEGFLAVRQFRADFAGESAHAGAKPEAGRNAVQAMATAVQNLYAIPRHGDGATRVNAGRVGGGTAPNIVPDEAFIEGEVRGETTELMAYTYDRATTVLDAAADMHDCRVETETLAEAPNAASDDELRALVAAAAGANPDVESVVDRDDLGGSEDATYLMQRVQERGGLATYVGVGTDHPGGHHAATFDVDEATLDIAVDTLTGAVERAFAERP